MKTITHWKPFLEAIFFYSSNKVALAVQRQAQTSEISHNAVGISKFGLDHLALAWLLTTACCWLIHPLKELNTYGKEV